MRAKTLVLLGVLGMISVLVFLWSTAKRGAPPADPDANGPVAEADRPAAPPPSPEPTAPAAPPPPSPPQITEEGLLAQMRAALIANPAEALRLSREAERRFGDSPQAAERRRIAIEALVRVNDIAEARNQAEVFVRKYPGTDHARYVENLTGVHPRPSGPRGARPGPHGGSSL